MKWQHYVIYCVSHQNTCNYSLSAIDYKNYIDSYDLGKNLHLIPLITLHLIPKITFFIYNIGWNHEMKH